MRVQSNNVFGPSDAVFSLQVQCRAERCKYRFPVIYCGNTNDLCAHRLLTKLSTARLLMTQQLF